MDPYIAEIRVFPYNFAPINWAMCNGQLLPISQNTALFSILGTTYGGNGTTNFALPNLQGAAVVGPGQGPGLAPYILGQVGGATTVTLTASQLAAHNHQLQARTGRGGAASATPGPGSALTISDGGAAYAPGTSPPTPLSPAELSATGASQPHNNLMPSLTLNFCIALAGIFPPRS
ncbi:MAG: tail fiber protein [Solirubrobacteraceae bacterium]